jgi:UDP-GlcNAc:undecaprenyl-phosphate GlcNAc-1-phosphate transferase
MTLFILLALVSAAVTFGLSIVVLKLSHRYRLYPKIRTRDVHSIPTPRLGGIAMFFGVPVASALPTRRPPSSRPPADLRRTGKILAILCAALLIVALYVADDIWDLDHDEAGRSSPPASHWQGADYSLPIGGSPSGRVDVDADHHHAIVIVMNMINFIDARPPVAGVALIANGVFFLHTPCANDQLFNLASLIAAVLIGACLGFLPLNWHPAKLFMGDAGALLVGLLMATSAIAITGQIDPTAVNRSQLFPAFSIILPFDPVIPLLDFAGGVPPCARGNAVQRRSGTCTPARHGALACTPCSSPAGRRRLDGLPALCAADLAGLPTMRDRVRGCPARLHHCHAAPLSRRKAVGAASQLAPIGPG